MRDEHPIDKQFREALSGAEAQPPASVWEGVKNRRRRRGMAFWSRRRGLTIVTLFVTLGAGAYWALRADRVTTHDADQPDPSPATHATNSRTSSKVETSAVAPVTGTAFSGTLSTTASSNEPVELIAGEDAA